MNIWKILGVEATSDKSAIKKAYNAKLRTTRPDDDQQAFIELRTAYEYALERAQWAANNGHYEEEDYDQDCEDEEDWEQDEYELDEEERQASVRQQQFNAWVQDVTEVYTDYNKRNQAANWKKLLYNGIPYQIDFYESCRNYLLHGLIYSPYGTVYMLKESRSLIDEFFSYSATPLERVKSDDRNMLNAINRHFKLHETIEFDKVIPDEEKNQDIDYFLNRYDDMVRNELPFYERSKMDWAESAYDLKGAVCELKEHEIFYLPLECLYLALHFDKYTAEEIKAKITEFRNQCGDAPEIELLKVEYKIYLGDRKTAKEQLKGLYTKAPVKNYCVLYQMAVCCMKLAMWYEAYMLVKMLTWLNPAPFMEEMVENICEALGNDYLRKEKRGEEISDLEQYHFTFEWVPICSRTSSAFSHSLVSS